jgi:signal transduction histidine kinase
MTPFSRVRRFQASFRSRLFFIFTAFTGFIFAAFMAVLITGEIRSYQQHSAEKAQLLASLLAGSVTLHVYSENIGELQRHAAEMLASTPQVVRVSITNNDGRLLADITSPTAAGKQLSRATVPVISSATSPSAEAALSGAAPAAAVPLGMVTVAIDTGNMRSAVSSALLKSGGMALLFWLAVVAACYPALKRVTRSFITLTDGLETMMTGNYSTKIIIEGEDEAGRAAQAVNRLAETLEEREAENSSLQEELVKAVRLEAQEERQKIMAKLIQTNRMTSLGLLISSLAHNINTPNGAIKLAAQHLDSSWKDIVPILELVAKEEGDFSIGGFPFGEARGEIKGAIDSIRNNATRVERVIQDLRTYNLGERNELHPGVSVNRVVEEALTIIRAHGRQGEIAITPALTAGLPDIVGNQYQLEQVVVNLLLNAMQAMPDNRGAVAVRTGYTAETAEVWITVSDEGTGIAPETRKRLFEAFFTTRLEKGGSGLGLYISKFIVSEHKGRLTVESEPANGTVATVTIPLREATV